MGILSNGEAAGAKGTFALLPRPAMAWQANNGEQPVRVQSSAAEFSDAERSCPSLGGVHAIALIIGSAHAGIYWEMLG